MRSELAFDKLYQASDDTAVTITKICAAVVCGLDQLRAARLEHVESSPPTPLPQATPNQMTVRPAVAVAADYIDLTEE